MENSLEKCRENVLRFLDRRGHTRRELETKLYKRDYPAKDIRTVLNDFERTGLINDRQFATDYITFCIHSAKAIGPSKIRANLYKHGVDSELIEETLQAFTDDPEIEYNKAIAAAEGKMRRLKPAEDRYRKFGKIVRFLAGRGFSSTICTQAADFILNQQQDD